MKRAVAYVGMLTVAFFTFMTVVPAHAQILLEADGTTETYSLIESALGIGTADETPDCAHPEFGPHITQSWDDALGKYVFSFFIHVTPDNDRCLVDITDRQRNEIKTFSGSPDYSKGFYGDTTTYRWYFKLADGFQPSPNFTHIHQIKAGDGTDADLPLITITPRYGSPNQLEIIYTEPTADGGASTDLTTADLSGFEGEWIEANESILHSTSGTYALELKRVSDGAVLLSCTNSNLNMWRADATFNRPKWGIYRSILSSSYLRDEEVRFADFALAKGSDTIPNAAPAITIEPSDMTAFWGQHAALTAAANGTPPLQYQWWFNATNELAWGTNATLVVANVQSVNEGDYSVVVSSDFGSATSAVASLTVTTSSNEVYDAAGVSTWVCPDGVTSVQVECWGAGGAGGSAWRNPNSLSTQYGGGGAGGAYARYNSYAVTPGNTYYINVGTGGVNNSDINDTTVPGGDSWFNSTNEPSSVIIAKGGAGGESAVGNTTTTRYGLGGAGTSSGSAGDVVYAGGSGADSSYSAAGGGGSSAGTNSDGTDAVLNVGATAPVGGGDGGTGPTTSSGPGGDGQNPGGGGSGGRDGSGTLRSGGTGADGQIVLTYALNLGLSVNLTAPANGASYEAPADITLTAIASDTDGTILSVDFYAGSTLLESDTSSPYSIAWTNVSAGSYDLTAVATDDGGLISTSSVVSITVTNASGSLTETQLLTVDFESDTVGQNPVADYVSPSVADSTNFVTVVDSSVNTAGTGNGLELYDNGTDTGSRVAYDFSTGESVIRFDISLAQLLDTGAAYKYYSICILANGASPTASANRYAEVRVYDNGDIRYYSNAAAGGTLTDYMTVGTAATLTMYANDSDVAISNYQPGHDLAANSVDFWLDGTYWGTGALLASLSDLTTAGLGRVAVASGSSDILMDYVFDDIGVWKITSASGGGGAEVSATAAAPTGDGSGSGGLTTYAQRALIILTETPSAGTAPFTYAWKKVGSETVLGTESNLVVYAPVDGDQYTCDVAATWDGVTNTSPAVTLTVTTEIDPAKVAIVKADDFRGPVQAWTNFLDASRALGIHVGIGVICTNTIAPVFAAASPAEYQSITNWMQAQEAAGDVEFWNHAWVHTYYTDTNGVTVYEYKNSGLAYQQEILASSQAALLTALGHDALAFGAPYNQYDADTAVAVNATPALKMMFVSSTSAAETIGLDGRVVTPLIIGESDGTGLPNAATFISAYPTGPAGPVALQFHPPVSVFTASNSIVQYEQIIQHLLANGYAILTPSEYIASLPVEASFCAAPVSGGAPLTVTFTDSSLGSPTGRYWDFGDGTTTNITAASLTHTYNLPGTNSVQLVVSDTNGSSTNTQAGLIVATSVDTVGDSVPDWWRAQYFGGDGSSTNADSSATADSDEDGVSNYAEYMADTDPTRSASRLALIGLAFSGSGMEVTWIGGFAASQYIEYRSSLTDTNGWMALYTNTPPTSATNTLLDTGAGDSSERFYRIRATR